MPNSIETVARSRVPREKCNHHTLCEQENEPRLHRTPLRLSRPNTSSTADASAALRATLIDNPSDSVSLARPTHTSHPAAEMIIPPASDSHSIEGANHVRIGFLVNQYGSMRWIVPILIETDVVLSN